MPRISLPYNWAPRPDQLPLWRYLLNGGTRAVEVAHRRWGKDDVALHATAVASQRKVGNYWHMLPEYGQARKAIWEAVNPRTGKRRIDEAFPREIRSQAKSQEMLIKFKNGSTWQLVGSDNYDSLVGSPPIGVVFSEYALANPMAWGYIRPILLENGGWAAFIYTSRGDNHGKTQYELAQSEPGWFAEMIRADQSPVFTRDQLEQERREMILEYGPDEGNALFLQEYMCSFEGALPGAYYGKSLSEADADSRITFIPYLVGFEVYTFWDLGIDDSMSIWFMQPVGQEFRFIDYYENTGYGLDHYARVLKDRPYVYGDHYMPHDAAAKSIQTGKSTRDYAEGLGIRPIITVPRARDTQAVLAGIQAGRKIMSQCFFDRKKCAHGLSALRNYHSEYDPKRKKPGNTPVHDWSSHGADSYRTFAVGFRPKIAHRTIGTIMREHTMAVQGVW